MPPPRRVPPLAPPRRNHPPSHELEPLVGRCLAGDESAWRELFARFERLIYVVIRRIGFTDPEGADIYQRVAITLYEKLNTVRNLDHLGAWIITTTRRECFSERRRMDRERRSRAHEEEALEVADPRLFDVDVDRLVEMARVSEEIGRLSTHCRDLLTLLFLTEEPPSYTVVAARLGVPTGSVGPNRARCLAELRRQLAKRALVKAFGKRRSGRGAKGATHYPKLT